MTAADLFLCGGKRSEIVHDVQNKGVTYLQIEAKCGGKNN
jgi:hypothetical protein